jgi:hypothetical protein
LLCDWLPWEELALYKKSSSMMGTIIGLSTEHLTATPDVTLLTLSTELLPDPLLILICNHTCISSTVGAKPLIPHCFLLYLSFIDDF